MYQTLGGVAALNATYENSKVILALAGYATRWNFEEGYIVPDKIRRDVVCLQRTIMLIQLEIVLNDGISTRFSVCARRPSAGRSCIPLSEYDATSARPL